MPTDLEGDWDGQDQAEVFDEDNQSLDGAGDMSAEMRTFEEMPDVYDVTRAVGDEDDDAAAFAEDLDDDEIIDLERDSDMADIEDDELAARMPEAFDDDSLGQEDVEEVYHDEETGLDLREDMEGFQVVDGVEASMNEAADDEVELEFRGDLNDATLADARRSRQMEARNLDDDDLEDLGYPGEDEPAQRSDTAEAQRRR